MICISALIGVVRLGSGSDVTAGEVTVQTNPDALDRGESLAHICASCHSSTDDLPLGGGDENFLEGLATLYAPNLTPGGEVAEWSDGEVIRAIREGRDDQGRPLLIMPSGHFHLMSDSDVEALVAFLRSQPTVTSRVPDRDMGLVGSALVGLGLFPTAVQPPITGPIDRPPIDATVEYGRYAVGISACSECHGPDLGGGEPGGFTPVGPPLPSIVSTWEPDEFIATIRTGVDPAGRDLDPEMMPWPLVSAAFSDLELEAMYEYIRSLDGE